MARNKWDWLKGYLDGVCGVLNIGETSIPKPWVFKRLF